MAKELHKPLYNLTVSKRWNLTSQILEIDVQALREDVFPIPTTFQREGVAKTGGKKCGTLLIQDPLSPHNLAFQPMS